MRRCDKKVTHREMGILGVTLESGSIGSIRVRIGAGQDFAVSHDRLGRETKKFHFHIYSQYQGAHACDWSADASCTYIIMFYILFYLNDFCSIFYIFIIY